MSDMTFRPDQDEPNPLDVEGRTPFSPEEFLGDDDTKPKPLDTVPVDVVNKYVNVITRPAPRLEVGAHAINIGASTEPQTRVLGKQEARRSLLLVNSGTVAIKFGPRREGLGGVAGFPLAPGASWNGTYSGEIYAQLTDPAGIVQGELSWTALLEDG